jgi:[FeFe] hydrogenase H-cluster maturation GTPase HydF
MDKGREHKPHIGIFGRRNSGKSSLLNALTGQDVAIVSEHPGTTTDPVKKSIELSGVGPAIMIDTAGIDDVGDLGRQRVQKSKEVLKIIDLALLVLNNNELHETERLWLDAFYNAGIPWVFVHSKSDQVPADQGFSEWLTSHFHAPVVNFSSLQPHNLSSLLSVISKTIPPTAYRKRSLLGHFLLPSDIVLLIAPIDTEAPEGRLILPQVQAIRDILDNNCVAVVLKENETEHFLHTTGITPKWVICDTSVILKANATVPDHIPLTGFSILLAFYKGEFDSYLKGTPAIDRLRDGDRVLLLESCTHHVSCDDIGRHKIPMWMNAFTRKQLHFDIVAGLNHLDRPIGDYALVVQCGGCMITQKQIVNRLKPAIDAGIPVTNYGMAIAWMQGVYERAIKPFVLQSP